MEDGVQQLEPGKKFNINKINIICFRNNYKVGSSAEKLS